MATYHQPDPTWMVLGDEEVLVGRYADSEDDDFDDDDWAEHFLDSDGVDCE